MKPLSSLPSSLLYKPAQAGCWLVFALLLLPALLLERWLALYAPIAAQLWLLVLGWCSWTFVEYLLHRFYLHRHRSSATELSRQHLRHHQHPTEISVSLFARIAMLLLLALVAVVAVWLHNHFTLLAGFAAGIYSYLSMHWVLHQPWSARLFRRLYRYHFFHHWKYPNTCYGICVPWWDDLFQTLPPQSAKIAPRILAYYTRNHLHQEPVTD